MELVEFKKQIHEYFKEHGFEKIKNKYYKNSTSFLCMIDMSRSYFGPEYFFDYYFFLGEFKKPYVINRSSFDTYTPCITGRLYFTEQESCFCQYAIHNHSTLKRCLDKNFSELILPPFTYGVKYLSDNFGKIYKTHLDENKIKSILDTL